MRLLPLAPRGFTLIEVCLASIASAMIFMAVYGVFANAMRLRDKATVRIQGAQMRARAVSVIQNDLKCATITGGSIAAMLTTVPTDHTSQFPGYLQFTTTNAEIIDGQVGGDVQEIEYYVADDPSSSGSKRSGMLIRLVNHVLLSTAPVTVPQQELLPNVVSVEFNFYDGSTWQKTWTVTDPTTDPLPQAISVHVQFGAQGNNPAPTPIDLVVPWTTKIYIGASAASTAAADAGTTTGS